MNTKTSSLAVLVWFILYCYCSLLFAGAQHTDPTEGNLFTVNWIISKIAVSEKCSPSVCHKWFFFANLKWACIRTDEFFAKFSNGYVRVSIIIFSAAVEALKQIKMTLEDPYGNLKNWGKGDPCNVPWTGVVCYNATHADGYFHVEQLYVQYMFPHILFEAFTWFGFLGFLNLYVSVCCFFH